MTVEDALALGRGPAPEIEARIAAAGTECELLELRLAICAHHSSAGHLAARFAARMRELRHSPAVLP